VRLSDLLTLTVRGDSGWTFGRVHDFRVRRHPDGTAEIAALLVGSTGLVERLAGRAAPDRSAIRQKGFEIPWRDVAAIDEDAQTITIREAK
jgi:hypothetical protein